jgi:hypothetical protein
MKILEIKLLELIFKIRFRIEIKFKLNFKTNDIFKRETINYERLRWSFGFSFESITYLNESRHFLLRFLNLK